MLSSLPLDPCVYCSDSRHYVKRHALRAISDPSHNAGVDGFISRLRLALELRGITPNALGVRAGMQPGHIAHVLSGRRKSVNADTLLAIARALGVTTDWLLTGEGPIERPGGVVLAPAAEDVAEPSPKASQMRRAVEGARERPARASARSRATR